MRTTCRRLALILGPLLLAASSGYASTNVSGTISSNAHWTTAGSPYIITGNLYVQAANTPVLTIDPGVQVLSNSGFGLIIGSSAPGALIANGTSSQPITFSANGSTAAG